MRYLWPSILVLMLSQSALAVPRMSLPAGSPCATCHQNSNGGGGRNQVGWETSHKMGALDFGWGVRKNTIANDRISLGFDSRIQFVHLGRPRYQQDDSGQIEKVDPDFTAIPMQLQPEIGIKLNKWLSVTGQYNPGPDTSKGKICDPVFPGQSCFESALIIKPRQGSKFEAACYSQPSVFGPTTTRFMFVLMPTIAPPYHRTDAPNGGQKSRITQSLGFESSGRLSYGSSGYRSE